MLLSPFSFLSLSLSRVSRPFSLPLRFTFIELYIYPFPPLHYSSNPTIINKKSTIRSQNYSNISRAGWMTTERERVEGIGENGEREI